MMKNNELPEIDAIKERAKEILAFLMVSDGMTPEFTPEERAGIEIGMSTGITAAIEMFETYFKEKLG